MRKYLLPVILIVLLASSPLWAGGLFPGRGGGGGTAAETTYDPTASGYTATDMQAAMDEAAAEIDALSVGGLSDLDDLLGDTINNNLIDGAIVQIATSTGLGVSSFSNASFTVSPAGLVTIKANTFQPYDADLTSWGAISPTAPVFTGASITSGVAGSQQGALVLNSNTHAVYNFTLLPGTMTGSVSWRSPGAMPGGARTTS